MVIPTVWSRLSVSKSYGCICIPAMGRQTPPSEPELNPSRRARPYISGFHALGYPERGVNPGPPFRVYDRGYHPRY